jgi:hypothetical protein
MGTFVTAAAWSVLAATVTSLLRGRFIHPATAASGRQC